MINIIPAPKIQTLERDFPINPKKRQISAVKSKPVAMKKNTADLVTASKMK